jgi:hypothetical protein
MVDVVLIDTAHDDQVFNIALSDVPEKKDDLVSHRYELPAPEGPTTVAVKIIDMWGEEVLVTKTVQKAEGRPRLRCSHWPVLWPDGTNGAETDLALSAGVLVL